MLSPSKKFCTYVDNLEIHGMVRNKEWNIENGI